MRNILLIAVLVGVVHFTLDPVFALDGLEATKTNVSPRPVRVTISHDRNTSINRLVLPTHLLNATPLNSRREAPIGVGPSPDSNSSLNFRTILAGLALSAAAISLVLLKTQSPRLKVVAVGLVVFAAIVVAVRMAKADLPPLPYWQFDGHGIETREFQLQFDDQASDIKVIWGKAVNRPREPRREPIPRPSAPE